MLLDVARGLGVDLLDGGYAHHRRRTSTRPLGSRPSSVEPGDIVLVRTGHMQLFKARDRETYTAGPQPGLTMPTVRVVPRPRRRRGRHRHSRLRGVSGRGRADVLFPVHLLQLRDMGLTQGQNFDLEALAPTARPTACTSSCSRRRPCPFTGGVGSPVNPVAVK